MAQLIVAGFVGLTNEVSHGQNERVTWDCDIVTLKARETWLDPLTPDIAVTAPGYILFRADRCPVLSQKEKGGGVCFLVNQRWCNDAKLGSQSCSVELETLIINCRPFYSPREFSSVVLVGVYIPREVNAAKAVNQLADQVLAVENANPDSAVIVVDDFNHTCLSKALPRYKQHVDCPTRKDKTLDHCYTVYKGAYHASARAPPGKSDHNTIILIPAHIQKLKTAKSAKMTVKKWSPESPEALRGCFECTDWSVFEHACTDLDEYTDIVTAYVSFCVKSCIPTRTVCVYANDKPWFTKEVKNSWLRTLPSGVAMTRSSGGLSTAIARAKAEYKDKLEDQFSSNNTHAVWQDPQTITQYKAKSATISSDPTLPDQLNEFYARFDRQYSAAAETLHLHPPSSLTPGPTAGPPPTGHTSASGHQLSLQAPTLPPTGPALAINCRFKPPSPPPPTPPPDRPLVIRYRLQHPQPDLLLVISRLLLISPPAHNPVFTCGLTLCQGHRDRHSSYRRVRSEAFSGARTPEKRQALTTCPLRSCADQLAPVFAALFNKSLEQFHVPRCFKTSTIVPVPKKPSTARLNDYQPVALTSVVMKVFERLVLRSLKAATDHQLDPHHFAYRANRSVDDAVALALHHILQHLETSGTYARVLFVDFSSAFNTIIPRKLFNKLIHMGVERSLCV